jgi:hypothetical protein
MAPDTHQFVNDLIAWSEVARNFGIVVAGIAGLAIAWWRSRAANLQAQAALEQSDLARRDHITEIFNRAVGQLGEDKLEVRLGAIYTLRAICQDQRYDAYIWPIVETLSAVVRQRAKDGDAEIGVDVRAIVELLKETAGRRGPSDGSASAQS